NGIQLNGIQLNGIQLNGIQLNGMRLGGIRLDGIDLRKITLFGQKPADGSIREAVEKSFRYLIGCALPKKNDADENQAYAEITDFGGQIMRIRGEKAIDPQWRDWVPNLRKAGKMGVCVLELGRKNGDRVSHTPVNVDNFKLVLRYMVECALKDSSSVTVFDEKNAPWTLHGALGLAPEWETSPLSEAGQKRVSACLGARANPLRKTVSLSLRSPGSEIPIAITPVERVHYNHHEGAFWGDLFADEPVLHTCTVDGSGISGRVCTQSEVCGFTEHGHCVTSCEEYGRDGYRDCSGQREVINTFLRRTTRAAFGKRHACQVQPDNSLWCWGDNRSGQLGRETERNRSLAPVAVEKLGPAVAHVDAGPDHTCARRIDGTVWCWGQNDNGELGVDSTESRVVGPEKLTAIGDNVTALSVGNTTCAVTTDGSLMCWGANQHGQLGIGHPSPHQLEPASINDLSNVIKVQSGKTTCALTENGQLWCWGHGLATGDGLRHDIYRPKLVEALQRTVEDPDPTVKDPKRDHEQVVDFCVANRHACAVRADGTVWCWGHGAHGELGNGEHGENRRSLVPVRVELLSSEPARPVTLSCGNHHTCVALDDGTAQCWGSNVHGQLGIGAQSGIHSDPAPVTRLGDVINLTAGRRAACAEKSDGTTWCWGFQRRYGLLGDGTRETRPGPVQRIYQSCGDGMCSAESAENATNCPTDCEEATENSEDGANGTGQAYSDSDHGTCDASEHDSIPGSPH
ncbi:MAG: hypothetical protein MJE77_34295, partial [Proteobacteria bacterium]|nr:hypothetical protein [Pseudomonadota bacterium]